jgi:hypothetical protein
LVIPASDLETLRSFDSRGHLALTVYLQMDGPLHRASVYDDFVTLMRLRLEGCGSNPECRAEVQEDLEIIGLYLRSNGHRKHAGLAIFSCAPELFWRAYPLEVAVPTRVTIGPAFDIEPLQILAPVS